MPRTSMMVATLAMFFIAAAPAAQAAFVEKKQVRLTCATLPYVFDCAIPLVTNPEFTSRCFYVAQGQSSLMRADHRMGFSNAIVSLQVNPGLAVTAVVTENRTGKQSHCEEDNE